MDIISYIFYNYLIVLKEYVCQLLSTVLGGLDLVLRKTMVLKHKQFYLL